MSSKSSRSFTQNFLILFTGNSIGQAIPFLLAPFISRIYKPEEIAVQENFLAMASLIAIVAAGRFDLAILIPTDDKKAKSLFSLSFIITTIVSLLSLITLLFTNQIAQFYNTPELSQYLVFLAPSIFLLSSLSIYNQWVLRNKKYPLLTSMRVLQSLVQNSGYVVLGYLGWGISGLFWAWIIGLFLPIAWMTIQERGIFKSLSNSRKELKDVAYEHRDFPMVNSIHAFTDILATQFLLYWLITHNYGALALGLFSVMNRYLRAPLNLVGSAVGQLYFREVGAKQGESSEQLKLFYRSIRIISLVTVPALVLVLFKGPWIFEIYLGENWREAGVLAQIMAPAILFNFIASVVSTTPLIFHKQKPAYVIGLTGHILSLGTLFIGSLTTYNFHQILMAYSGVLSLNYIFLIFWYRSLIPKAAI
ncbi:MAG TPA: oligosaccharide flippase family protein [Flavobacteriales bacterium]|nr:oligosaccharide flippase family protein [Flavobacteriales bacterium]